MPGAKLSKGSDIDNRQAGHAQTGVDGILHIGVVGAGNEVHAVVAKAEYVHDGGIGTPDPVSRGCPSFDHEIIGEYLVDERMIHSIAKVVADQQHAVDGVFGVDVVIDLGHAVIASI